MGAGWAQGARGTGVGVVARCRGKAMTAEMRGAKGQTATRIELVSHPAQLLAWALDWVAWRTGHVPWERGRRVAVGLEAGRER